MKDIVIGIVSILSIILLAAVYFAVGYQWHKYVCGCE